MNDYVHEVSEEEAQRIQRFLYWVAAGTVAFVLLVGVAVVTAPRWITLVSHESERKFMRPHVEWVSTKLLDNSEPAVQDYVAQLGQDIAAGMNLPPGLEIEFFVVDGATVNAFTTLGGYIFVIEGLVRELDSENSLAMVLAHEIAHAVYRDPLSSASRGLLLQILIASLAGGGAMDTSTGAELGSDVMLNAYSRDQEEAADRLALAALEQYYGHVGGATELFETLQNAHGGDDVPEFLSSHPATGTRVATIEANAAQYGWRSGPTRPYPPAVRAALSSRP